MEGPESHSSDDRCFINVGISEKKIRRYGSVCRNILTAVYRAASEIKGSVLGYWSQKNILGQGKIDAAYAAILFAMSPGMFL